MTPNNSPLFAVEKYRMSKGWKHLGMPQLLGNGSQDIHGERHRFLIIPRFSTDIWKLFLQNNRQLPQHTVFRIGLQMVSGVCFYLFPLVIDCVGANLGNYCLLISTDMIRLSK